MLNSIFIPKVYIKITDGEHRVFMITLKFKVQLEQQNFGKNNGNSPIFLELILYACGELLTWMDLCIIGLYAYVCQVLLTEQTKYHVHLQVINLTTASQFLVHQQTNRKWYTIQTNNGFIIQR